MGTGTEKHVHRASKMFCVDDNSLRSPADTPVIDSPSPQWALRRSCALCLADADLPTVGRGKPVTGGTAGADPATAKRKCLTICTPLPVAWGRTRIGRPASRHNREKCHALRRIVRKHWRLVGIKILYDLLRTWHGLCRLSMLVSARFCSFRAHFVLI